jgi:tetratricopeptide (TPR) repeat protein
MKKRIWLFLLLLVGSAFALSCQIHARTPPASHPEHRSAGAVLLGESRLGISGYFYEMADLYFHRGVAHEHEEAIHDTWFQARLAELRPSAHVHAEGQASREVIPWLRLATLMNPDNVDFILVAAFWLHHEAGERDLAQKLLKDAQVNNPFEYEIQLERGRLYLYEGDVARARGCFDAALAFWPSDIDPAHEDARHDRARILLYRSLIHEVDGQPEQAIAGLRDILEMFPERAHLQDRIDTLERGDEPSLLGASVWNNLLQSEDEGTMLCNAEDEEEHVHDEHCGHGAHGSH